MMGLFNLNQLMFCVLICSTVLMPALPEGLMDGRMIPDNDSDGCGQIYIYR